MRPLTLVVLLACAGAGCTINHRPGEAEMQQATAPGGSIVRIQLQRFGDVPAGAYTGELLEVRDSSLILLAGEVIVADFRGVRRVVVEGRMTALSLSAQEEYGRGRPGAYLRPFSRYPYGAPAEAMQQILHERDQTEPRRVTP